MPGDVQQGTPPTCKDRLQVRSETTTNWRPIETAPPDKELLLYHPRTTGRLPLEAVMRTGRPRDWSNRPASHWMPLPEPPK